MNDRPNKKIRLAIVEPSPLLAAGLQSVLTGAGGEFDLCGLFDELDPLFERAPIVRPDLVLIDPAVIDFRKRNTLHGLFDRLPETTWVAVVYGFIEPETLKQYHGAVHIYDDRPKIVRKLRRAIEERARESDNATGENYELTDRESEILVSVAKGMTNKEIADALNLSVHTVATHRRNISAKLEIHSSAGLAIYAIIHNLIDLSEVHPQK